MANEGSTSKISVDISELTKAMKDAQRLASLADSEFQKVSSTCGMWTHSSDALSAKIKSLNSTLDVQKTKLTILEAEYADVVAEQGKGSTAAQELEIEINKQQAAINKTTSDINHYGDKLTDVSKAEKIAAATGKDVSEVLDDMGDSAKDAEGGFTVLKGTLATFAGNAMTALAGSIKDGIMNLAGLADETREYRNEMAKLETAFASNGHSADAAKATYEEFYSVLGDEGQAVEAVSHLAKLTDSEKDLSTWTDIATGVYAQFGASLPIEGLTEAANETAKVGQVTGPLADALNWAGESEEKFNEKLEKCSNEQERQKLIMDTLNGLYSESADTFREVNGEVLEANKAQSALTDAQARLGAVAEPVITSVKQGFADLLSKVLELVEGVDMGAFTAKIEQGFAVLKDDVLPAIQTGLQWILDNKDMLIAGLAGIAGGFAAFQAASLINTAVTSFKAFKAAQDGATISQWLLNAAMNANPIMLIVTVIAAVVTAIVTFIATNDNARAKIVEIWNAIKEFFGTAIDAIVKFFTETIPQGLETMGNFFKELPGKFSTWFAGIIAKVTTWASNMATKAKETGSKFINTIVTFFKELPGKIWTWLVNVVSKVTTWAGNMATKAKDAATKFINNVVNFVKELPGKVWTWLVNVVSKVTTWASDMANKGKTAATNFVNNVVNFIKNLPSKIWSFLTSTASKVVSWGSDLAAKGKAAATQLFNAIVNKVKEIPSKMLSAGTDIVKGLWNGISNSYQWIKDKISGWVGNVTDFIKKLFGIKSPSTVMRDEVGVWLGRGVAVGMDKALPFVEDAAKNIKNTTLEALNNTDEFEKAGEAVADGFAKTFEERLTESNTTIKEEAEKGYSNIVRFLTDSEEEFAEIMTAANRGRAKSSQIEFTEFWTNVGDGVFELVDKSVKVTRDGQKVLEQQQKAAAKDTVETAGKTSEAVTEIHEKELKDLQYLKDLGVISEAKYYTELEKIRDKYFAVDSDEWREHTLSILDYTNGIIEEMTDSMTAKFEEIVDGAAEKVEELEDLRKSIADMLKEEGNLTYNTVSILAGNEEIKFTELADVGSDNAILRQYNDMLDELAERRGVLPSEIAGYLSEMGLNEGMAYVGAMLKASDAQFDKYVSDLREKTRLAEEISKKVTVTQTVGVLSEIEELAGGLPETFSDIGIDSAADWGESFLTTLSNVLIEVKAFLSEGLSNILSVSTSTLTKDIISNVRGKILDIRGTVSNINSGLSGAGNLTAGGVVNNYTQIINSPTAVNRTDLYRNTKNLLGFAGGVR